MWLLNVLLTLLVQRVVSTMVSQGLWGALQQYWTVEPKPRLERRNTYFEDVQLSNLDVLKLGIVVSVSATAIGAFWCLLGVVL